MTVENIVQSLAESTQRGQEQYKSLAQSSKTRLVWFVGISGFAILNVASVWDEIMINPIEGIDIFWLTLPWLLSVFSALITHFLMDKADIHFSKFINNKLSLIELHKIQVTNGIIDEKEFKLLLYDNHPDLEILKDNADNWINCINIFETITFGSLVIGFIWAIIFPLFGT